MTTKVVGYVRVSSKGQLDGNGPERQEKTIREFVERQGMEVVKVFTEAYTGTEADRPILLDMLTELLSNGVRTVVVESLDRFARDLLIQSSLIAKMQASGVTLLSAATGEDVTAAMQDDPMRRALVQIQGVFSELDKRLIVRKLRKARDAKRATGMRCEGAKPFGTHEGEALILERVRQLRRKPRGGSRLTWQAVADRLNQEGLLNRRGTSWTRQALHKLCKSIGIC
jgi:DNA invertase Pin-like site-specific DNA recombinase